MPQHRFKKGQSGNPGGRPKAERAVVEAARAAGPRCVEVLTELLEDDDKRVRIAAAAELLNRGFSKARQTTELHGRVDHVMSVQEQHLQTVRELSRCPLDPPAEDAKLVEEVDGVQLPMTEESRESAKLAFSERRKAGGVVTKEITLNGERITINAATGERILPDGA